MIRILCANDTMQYESLAQRLLTGFVLRCTCRVLKDAVDWHGYTTLGKVPVRSFFQKDESWYHISEMIFEVARLGLFDNALVRWILTHPKQYLQYERTQCAETMFWPRPWNMNLVCANVPESAITTGLVILDGLRAKGQSHVPSCLLADLVVRHDEYTWKRAIRPMAAMADWPDVYYANTRPTLHWAWKPVVLLCYKYERLEWYNTNDDIPGGNHMLLLYLYGACRCFDALLASIPDPKIRRRQMVTIRSNACRMLHHLYHDGDKLHKKHLIRLVAHLDARFKEGVAAPKRKRKDNAGKKVTKRPKW